MRRRLLPYFIPTLVVLVLSCAHAHAGYVGYNVSVFDFKWHNVTIIVKDQNGQPVKGAYVKAFSLDWGLMYPRYEDWGVTDDSGVHRFLVTSGNWVFYCLEWKWIFTE
jgi:hypothetical protein